MKWDKGYYTTCAIHKMFDRGKIDKDSAITLLMDRVRLKKQTATATVELWHENIKRII